MSEDNTVSESFGGHRDRAQREGIPALNKGVYDRQCLCKSPSLTSSSYRDHRRRPAPLPYGHFSSLQLMLTPSSDIHTILSRPVLSSQTFKVYMSGIISKSLHNHPVQLVYREEPLPCIKLSPLLTLHGSWWHRGVNH